MTDSEHQEPGRSGQPSQPGPRHGPSHGAPPPHSLVLCGARLADGRTVDVQLVADRIEAVGTAGSLGAGHHDGTRVDLSGYLLLPAPAEPHAHYDTALTADTDPPHTAAHAPARTRPTEGTSWGPEVPVLPPVPSVSSMSDETQRRTTEAALLQLGQGATALRTHVRVGDVVGLSALEAVLQARRSLRGLVDLSTVAVPRLLTGTAGAEGLAILRDAVKMGASAVGGCPDLDPDPGGYVEAVLNVAAEHGCAVDLHTDGGDPARLTRLAAVAGGLRPGVSIGPCGGLARLPHQVALRTADQLAAAGVTVVALPQGNCGALERPSPSTPSRVAPVRMLAAAGVTVAAGGGALRDACNPVGRGDPLEAAYLLASHGESSPAGAYEAVSGRARAAMGLPEVRVEAGFPAELLAVRGSGLAAVLSLAYSRVVVHRGRVVARTSAVREFCGLGSSSGLGLPRQSQG